MRLSFHIKRFLALVLLVSALFSCDLVNKEGASYPFKLNVDAVDGTILGDGTVIKKPELNFRIEGEDDTAVYSMVYSIDGSEDMWKRNIPAGSAWNLQGEFAMWKLYGSHTVKGKVILDKDANRTVSFNVTIWIKYAPANVSEVYFNTTTGRKLFKDKCVLVTGTSGEMVVAYVPETSLLHVELTSVPEGVLDFALSSMQREPGFIRIPYEVKEVGEPVVTLVVSNGPDSESYAYEVDCREDDVAKTFKPYLGAADLVFEGVPVSVSAGLSSGNIEIEYDVDFAVDGNPSVSVDGVSLSEPLEVTLSTEGLETGTHEASCSVVPYSGGVQPQEASDLFYVYRPRLRVTDENDVTKYLWPGESMEVTVGRSYYVTPEGLPEQYADFVGVSCDGNRGQLAGSVYSPTRSGNGTLTLSVTDGKGGSASFGLEQRERIAVAVETPVFTVESYPVWASVRLVSGDSSRQYDVDFLVDGTKVDGRKGVYLSDVLTVSLEAVASGDHTLQVSVSDSEGFSTTATASAGFVVGLPSLEVRDYSDNVIADLPFGSSVVTDLDYGKAYSMSVKGIPTQAKSLFSLKSADGTDQVTGVSYWSVVPNVLGAGNITVHMDSPANLDFPFAFVRYSDLRVALDSDSHAVVKAAVSGTFAAGDALVFDVKYKYYGKMRYYTNTSTNLNVTALYMSTAKSEVKKDYTVSGPGSVSLMDLASVAKAWEDDPYEYLLWSDEGYGYNVQVKEYAWYVLVVESLSVDVYGTGKQPVSKYYRVSLVDGVNASGWLSGPSWAGNACAYGANVHMEE